MRQRPENIDPNLMYEAIKKPHKRKLNPRISTESNGSQSNFVECITTYIKSMAKNPLSKPKSNKASPQLDANYKALSLSIEKEKKVNKHLQKCVIQMQKVLWERNQNLEQIELELKRKRKLRSSKRDRIISQETSVEKQTIQLSEQQSQEPYVKKKTSILKPMEKIFLHPLNIKQNPKRKK